MSILIFRVCNLPHTHADSGGWTSSLPTTDSLGCGSWAGNLNWESYLNYTLPAIPRFPVSPSLNLTLSASDLLIF